MGHLRGSLSIHVGILVGKPVPGACLVMFATCWMHAEGHISAEHVYHNVLDLTQQYVARKNAAAYEEDMCVFL